MPQTLNPKPYILNSIPNRSLEPKELRQMVASDADLLEAEVCDCMDCCTLAEV